MGNGDMNHHSNLDNPARNRPNLRHYHRIEVDLEATLITDDDTIGPCTIRNLSRSGIMVPCSSEILDRVLPNHEPVAPHLAVPITVDFDLSSASGESIRISCRCDVIYVRRVARDCFHVGMSFVRFDEDGEQQVDEFINRQLAAGA